MNRWRIAFLALLVFVAIGAFADQQLSGWIFANVGQFGGVAVSTGAGAAGTGIPRFTASALDPCQDPNVAKSSVAITVANTTATAVVAGVSAKVIYPCQAIYTLAGTAPTSTWSYAATCGTSPTNLTGAMAPTTGSLMSLGGSGHTITSSIAAASALCLTLGGTSPSAQGVLTFVQK